MRNELIFAVILVALFIGCTTGPQCNKPYMPMGYTCCLDKDDNRICDMEETTSMQTRSTTTTITTTTTTTPYDIDKEAELCSLMRFPVINECYHNLAIKSQDATLCGKISFENCSIPEFREKFFFGCTTEFGVRHGKDICYIDLAKSLKSVYLCDMAEQKGNIHFCYRELAKVTGDSRVCKRMLELYETDEKIREEVEGCYFVVAYARLNSSLCNKMSIEAIKDACYVNIAEETNNVSLCGLGGGEAYGCYREIAIATKNISLCDKMPNELNKESCIKGVNL